MDPEKLNAAEQERIAAEEREANIEASNEVTDENTQPEEEGIPVAYKQIVAYDYGDIVNILKVLNEKTPIVGIDAMRNIVAIFDTLNNGTPQQAYVNAKTGEVLDGSSLQGLMNPMQGGPIEFPVEENSSPELISEGEPIDEENPTEGE